MPDENSPNPALVVQVVLIRERHRLYRLIVRGAIVVAGLYVAIALPVRYSAGEITAITIFYSVISESALTTYLTYAVTVVFFGLWVYEIFSRRMAVKREHRRIDELEKKLDPNRTSSELLEWLPTTDPNDPIQ